MTCNIIYEVLRSVKKKYAKILKKFINLSRHISAIRVIIHWSMISDERRAFLIRRKSAVVRTKKYGKLIRISIVFAVIAIISGLIAYGWQQYEDEKYPNGTEKDYSLPNAFLSFAGLINDFITQNSKEEDLLPDNSDEPVDEEDNIIIVGSNGSDVSESNNEQNVDEEPEIMGGIVPEKENASYYSFKNTLFVGDYFVSQIDYIGVFGWSKFAYSTDLDMNTILTKKVIKLDGNYVTVADYAAIFSDIEAVYIVISAESVSWMDCPTFVKKYTAFVDEITAAFPEAHIYVQPILPINEEKAKKRGYSVTNEKINAINEYIYSIANERNFWILDMAALFKDKNGELPEEYTTNGIRFEKDIYELWSEYIVTHKAH